MNTSVANGILETMGYDTTLHTSTISLTDSRYLFVNGEQHGNSCTTCENETTNADLLENNSTTGDLAIPLYIYILASLCNSVIFCAGIAGNILVIFVILKVRQLRTPMNLFLLNLSVADILVLLICQPAGLLEFFGKDRWFLGQVMCKLVPLMENSVLHVSIMTILAVTLERYQALCRPLKRFIAIPATIPSTIKTIIAIWIIGLILTVPFLLMTDFEDAIFYDGTPVKVCRTKINETWRFVYMIFIFLFFFALPFFVILCIYVLIIKKLTSEKLRSLAANDRSAMSTLRSRKQVVKMLIIIIVLFFTSLFPIRVVSLWLIFTRPQDVSRLGLEGFLNLILWARTLMYINSAVNPVIYSLTSTRFKMAFKRVLSRTMKHSHTRRTALRSTNQRNEGMPEMLLQPQQRTSNKWETNLHRQERPYLVIRLVLVPRANTTLRET